jgi:hypothetical protein
VTRSEDVFERFLTANGIPFRRVPTTVIRTPDYEIAVGGVPVVVEVKELTEDLAFSEAAGSRTVGDHIRRKIAQAGPQLQTASKEGKPTILLVFNGLDPMQQFGTEDHDFEHAMYGEYTVRLDRGIGEIVDSFHGRNAKLRVAVNTSFSAVGRLKQSGGGAVEVTLFENIHARVPLNYEALPVCLEVVRVERAKS